jgi:hypothetical protein
MPQEGHNTAGPATSFLWVRLLSRRQRDILVFGWAMPHSSVQCFALHKTESVNRKGKSRGLRRTTAFIPVSVAPAPIAQPRTTAPAKRIFRKIGQNQFTQPRDKVHLPGIPILLVFGITRAPLAAMNEKAVLRNRSGERERIEAADTCKVEAILDVDMNGNFRSLPTDRPRDMNGLVSQREIRKCLGVQEDIDRILVYPADIRNSFHMVLEFTNG